MAHRRGCLEVEAEKGGDRVDGSTKKRMEIKVNGGRQR